MTIGPIDRREAPDLATDPSAAWRSSTAFSLLLMALLAPFAQFGVLQTLIVPADAAATTTNIAASAGLFRRGDRRLPDRRDPRRRGRVGVVRAPATRQRGPRAARRVAARRLCRGLRRTRWSTCSMSPSSCTARPGRPCSRRRSRRRSASSVASFANGWNLALAIFGLHLVGLGALLFRSVDFPRFLGALVILAGIGYLADSFGKILLPGYSLTDQHLHVRRRGVADRLAVPDRVQGVPNLRERRRTAVPAPVGHPRRSRHERSEHPQPARPASSKAPVAASLPHCRRHP